MIGMEFLLVFVVGLLAGTVGGVVGTGSSIILMPVLILAWGPLEAVPVMAIAAFMGNTEYRGKIIWFLMTARPDLLPVDLKRQGRAEEHLALFYPQTDAERE